MIEKLKLSGRRAHDGLLLYQDMRRTQHSYSAFGLGLTSEIELPELAPLDTAPDDSISIRLGRTPRSLEGAASFGGLAFATKGTFLLDVEPGRFLVRTGREIIVEPKPAGSARDLRGYLLGSAIGALCLQRGLLPLHANAIVGDDGAAVAFAGPSGAGKSTLAAYFLDQGRRVLCDDVCVVTNCDGETPQAWPGVARIKLWSDALASFGRSAEGLERVFDADAKYSLSLAKPGRSAPAPLRAIFVLEMDRVSGAPIATRLSRREALDAIIANTYRWEFAAPLGVAGDLFTQAAALARASSVWTIRLPSDPKLYLSRRDELNHILATA